MIKRFAFSGIMISAGLVIIVKIFMKKFQLVISRRVVESSNAPSFIITRQRILFREKARVFCASKTLDNSKKKIRRGRGESKMGNNCKNTNLTIVGNNAAGLTGKLDSLKRVIQIFQPGVLMLQKTKLKKQGNKWGLSCAKLRKISLCLIWCDLYYLSIIWKNELFRRLHIDPSPLISVRNCSIFISLLLPPPPKKNHHHPNFYKTPYLFFYSCYLCTALKI